MKENREIAAPQDASVPSGATRKAGDRPLSPAVTATPDKEEPVSGDVEQKARAWDAVCRAISRADPDWLRACKGSGAKCAVEAIDRLGKTAHSASGAKLPDDVIACLRRVIDPNDSYEPLKNLPAYWPAQDEQGGCVLCGNGTVTKPASTVEEHAKSCGFRAAYEVFAKYVGVKS